MDLMVQDLINLMFAQIRHVLLGAHANTIMGGWKVMVCSFIPILPVKELRFILVFIKEGEGFQIFLR